jgi:hypothetical protein
LELTWTTEVFLTERIKFRNGQTIDFRLRAQAWGGLFPARTVEFRRLVPTLARQNEIHVIYHDINCENVLSDRHATLRISCGKVYLKPADLWRMRAANPTLEQDIKAWNGWRVEPLQWFCLAKDEHDSAHPGQIPDDWVFQVVRQP